MSYLESFADATRRELEEDTPYPNPEFSALRNVLLCATLLYAAKECKKSQWLKATIAAALSVGLLIDAKIASDNQKRKKMGDSQVPISRWPDSIVNYVSNEARKRRNVYSEKKEKFI